MGCYISKSSNSKGLLTKADEGVTTNLTVKGVLIPNSSEIAEDKKKQTTPDQDSERLCMWCIVNLEDDIVNKLYKDNWCLGSECQSMNEKNESKNYCYLYKYKTDHQIIEKQFLSLEEDLERNYQWLSKSIFIEYHNLDIINLQEEGWILGNHSEIFKSRLPKDCFYYLFKNKNTIHQHNGNNKVIN
tara:strand:+ start:240 stop:800 length:561 start_codon:yes stop_codon:yes gene_type:complete